MIGDSPLVRAFWENGLAEDCPVIDVHGHMGAAKVFWFPRPDAEQMVYSMDRAGVRLLCFTPHSALFCPEMGNRESVEAVRRFPERLRAYYGINPHYMAAALSDLAAHEQHLDVFIGIKLLPDYHKVALTDARYEPALRWADERALPVLTHTWGGSAFDGPVPVRAIAAKYRRSPLLLGHSLHGAWDEAIAVAKEFPNVYLELCAVLDNDRGIIEKFVEAGLSRRMLFGTDLPWFAPHRGIGAILSADITDEDRHSILHRNAERMLGLGGPD